MTWSIGGGPSSNAHEVHAAVKEAQPPEGLAQEERAAFERARKAILLAMQHTAEGSTLEAFTASVYASGHGASVSGVSVSLTRK